MDTEVSLKYVDEDDRCYGLTGMAMAIVVWDCENLLSSIDVDASPDTMMEFAPQYYFSGNPRLSAKLAWTQLVEHFQLSMGLMISNVLCRNCVLHRKEVRREMIELMMTYLTEEGQETCSLDKDEIDSMFNKSYNYLFRLFNHHGVQSIAHDFAAKIKNRRRLSVSEVVEELRALSML